MKEDVIEKLKKQQEERVPRIIKWMEEMEPFDVDNLDSIPEPPILEKELYEKYVIPNFIRCGAIPKDKLIEGKTYIGTCRNASEAVWNGKEFVYKRTKFGYTYDEDINHFQDDDGSGYDVFVPLKIKE